MGYISGKIGFSFDAEAYCGIQAHKHTAGIVLLSTNYILLYVGEENRVFVLRCVALPFSVGLGLIYLVTGLSCLSLSWALVAGSPSKNNRPECYHLCRQKVLLVTKGPSLSSLCQWCSNVTAPTHTYVRRCLSYTSMVIILEQTFMTRQVYKTRDTAAIRNNIWLIPSHVIIISQKTKPSFVPTLFTQSSNPMFPLPPLSSNHEVQWPTRSLL